MGKKSFADRILESRRQLDGEISDLIGGGKPARALKRVTQWVTRQNQAFIDDVLAAPKSESEAAFLASCVRFCKRATQAEQSRARYERLDHIIASLRAEVRSLCADVPGNLATAGPEAEFPSASGAAIIEALQYLDVARAQALAGTIGFAAEPRPTQQHPDDHVLGHLVLAFEEQGLPRARLCGFVREYLSRWWAVHLERSRLSGKVTATAEDIEMKAVERFLGLAKTRNRESRIRAIPDARRAIANIRQAAKGGTGPR